jgi:tellurite resistance protein
MMLTLMFVIMVIGIFGGYLVIAGTHTKRTPHRTLSQYKPAVNRDVSEEHVLHSRVSISEQESDEGACKSFSLGIRGMVKAPTDRHDINMQITIDDITNGRAEPVLSAIEQYQKPDSSVFLYNENKGKLPARCTMLSDWVPVASIRADALRLPRKGLRKLQFITAVVSSQTNERLATSITTCIYDNPEFGYIEILRNSTRTKELTIPLAISLANIDGTPQEEEMRVIRRWMWENFDLQDGRKSEDDRILFEEKLEKALAQAVKFFSSGGRIDIRAVSRDIVKIATPPLRLEIMRLCLNVAKADGVVTQSEMIVINKFASWLQVERIKFRAMLEQLIPLSICQAKDPAVLLGITSDMDNESICKYLNEEYRRWNARVTNADAKIREQAACMLDIIAQARNTYTLQPVKS